MVLNQFDELAFSMFFARGFYTDVAMVTQGANVFL